MRRSASSCAAVGHAGTAPTPRVLGNISADPAAGYWDAIIGPGKAIDTNKYYVLSSDTLVNLNAKMANVVTTGPASINPDTGKPYGMSFPVVSIEDFVGVQKALIDSLGIKKLKAVVGASMGGLQAYQWAASYPDSVDRIVAVVASPSAEPFLIGWLDMWAQPIRLDPKWNNGDYYDKEPPLDGLKAALELVTLQANSWNGRARHLERRLPRPARIRQGACEQVQDRSGSRANGGGARRCGRCQSFSLSVPGQSARCGRPGKYQGARARPLRAQRSGLPRTGRSGGDTKDRGCRHLSRERGLGADGHRTPSPKCIAGRQIAAFVANSRSRP